MVPHLLSEGTTSSSLDNMLRVILISHVLLPDSLVEYVEDVLNRIVPTEVDTAIMADLLEIAEEFLDPARGQVNAEKLLEYLRESTGPLDFLEKHVYIVDADAYVPRLNFVFGIAEMCGNIAIVFTRRLRPEFWSNVIPQILERPPELVFIERLEKEILHELGHTLCLEHCPNRRCVMSFSNTILDVDAKEADYCRYCSEKIRATIMWRKF